MSSPRRVQSRAPARTSTSRTRAGAAARADTPAALLAFQRTLKDAIVRPLGPGDRTQRRWMDGRPTQAFAAEFIKPNDRLTALDRLQIYNRMYWYRLLDCFYEDTTGLRALLGERRVARLAEAYLTTHPSSSFTLRDLCRNLAEFIRKKPRWTAPDTKLAYDIARFEWAQTTAFDEAALPRVEPGHIAQTPPARLKLRLQPYLTLLTLDYPADDYVIAVVKRDALRSAASNAASSRRAAATKVVRRPKPERVYVAVHRQSNRLFYKRLNAPAYRVLCALRDGEPLARAVARAGRAATPELVRDWFATWMQLGWLCRR